MCWFISHHCSAIVIRQKKKLGQQI